MKINYRKVIIVLAMISMKSLVAIAATPTYSAKEKLVCTHHDDSIVVSSDASNALKEGFYVGLAAGYDAYRIRQNINLQTVAYPYPHVFQQSLPLAPVGLVGGIFTGYGRYINNQAYLGVELFLNQSRATVTEGTIQLTQPNNQPSSYTSTISINESYGFKFHPGIRLSPSTRVYLQVGYTRASITTSEYSSPFAVSSHHNRETNGVSYGLGLETLVSKQVSLRGEYLHTKFNSFNQPSGSTFLPANNQFMVGLVLHFS